MVEVRLRAADMLNILAAAKYESLGHIQILYHSEASFRKLYELLSWAFLDRCGKETNCLDCGKLAS